MGPITSSFELSPLKLKLYFHDSLFFQDSPFYEMGPRDLLSSQFEIIVTLEGVTEETGNTIQVRSSYLPN